MTDLENIILRLKMLFLISAEDVSVLKALWDVVYF